MDIYVYSDESGVFDYKHNEIFVFGGLVFLSYTETENAIRLYHHAESIAKRRDRLPDHCEAKANSLSISSKANLVRSLNNFYKFGVVVYQRHVLKEIFKSKKSKQRYLDYAFKIAVKRLFESLIREGTIVAEEVSKLRICVDEHATATDGRYELRESLEQEFKTGTFNQKWNKYHAPIFPCLQGVTLTFCDSKTNTLIRAADIIANRIYHTAVTNDLNSIRYRTKFYLTYLP